MSYIIYPEHFIHNSSDSLELIKGYIIVCIQLHTCIVCVSASYSIFEAVKTCDMWEFSDHSWTIWITEAISSPCQNVSKRYVTWSLDMSICCAMLCLCARLSAVEWLWPTSRLGQHQGLDEIWASLLHFPNFKTNFAKPWENRTPGTPRGHRGDTAVFSSCSSCDSCVLLVR